MIEEAQDINTLPSFDKKKIDKILYKTALETLAIAIILIPSSLAAKEFYGKNAEAFVNNYLDEWITDHFGQNFNDHYLEIIRTVLIYSGTVINALFNSSCSWITVKSIAQMLKEICLSSEQLRSSITEENLLDPEEHGSISPEITTINRRHEFNRKIYSFLRLACISGVSHLANQGNIALALRESSGWKLTLSNVINYTAIYPGIMETCNKCETIIAFAYSFAKNCFKSLDKKNSIEQAIEHDLNKVIKRLGYLNKSTTAINLAIHTIPELPSTISQVEQEKYLQDIYKIIQQPELASNINTCRNTTVLFTIMMGTIVGYSIVGFKGTLDAFKETGDVWADACAVTGTIALIGFTAYVSLNTINNWYHPTDATLAKNYQINATTFYTIESLKMIFILISLFSFASGTNATYLANLNTLNASGLILDTWMCAAIIGTVLINVFTCLSDLDQLCYNIPTLTKSTAACNTKIFNNEIKNICSNLKAINHSIAHDSGQAKENMLLKIGLSSEDYQHTKHDENMQKIVLARLTQPNNGASLIIENEISRAHLSQEIYTNNTNADYIV